MRERGYAVSRGELEPALWGVSAPVLDAGRAVAVVSVWGSEARMRARGVTWLGEHTATTAAEIGARVAGAA